jgi:hypothetical protein
MRHSIRPTNLSVSSIISTSTTTSSLSPGQLSPRRGLLGPSPPPSPSLPSLIPRHGKKKPAVSYSSLRGLLLAFGALVILGWLALSRLSSSSYNSPFENNPDYEIVSDDALPRFPSAVIVTDSRGHNRWTVSIPSQYQFPLRPTQYREICEQADHIGLEMERSGLSGAAKKKSGYYTKDPSFMDIGEAQKKGLLPKPEEHSLREGIIGLKDSGEEEVLKKQAACEKSLTYVMETDDAGMGNSLMGLWLAYGLAKTEGRAFFVDDTRWPYGNYTTYFASPPLPDCTPAPRSQRVPCPRSAAHLVISSATFHWNLGEDFRDAFVDMNKKPRKQNHRIFALMRLGYEALFQLADAGDGQYVTGRVSKEFGRAHETGGMNVGLHVRRGDVHPWEYQFSADYLPLIRYMDEVRDILITTYEHDDEGAAHGAEHEKRSEETPIMTMLEKRHGAPGLMASQLFLASDDPDVYTAPEVSRALRAQDRIVLASKAVLEQEAAKNGGKKNHWIDEIHGWEGGFYRDQFFGLGMPESSTAAPPGPGGSSLAPLRPGSNPEQNPSYPSTNSHHADAPGADKLPSFDLAKEHELEEGLIGEDDPVVPESAMALRQLVGRAYLLDLAVLSQADAVVCAVSAAACRILAVMMGWEKSIVQNAWRNVDGGYPWSGIVLEDDEV